MRLDDGPLALVALRMLLYCVHGRSRGGGCVVDKVMHRYISLQRIAESHLPSSRGPLARDFPGDEHPGVTPQAPEGLATKCWSNATTCIGPMNLSSVTFTSLSLPSSLSSLSDRFSSRLMCQYQSGSCLGDRLW